MQEINQLSLLIKNYYQPEKINVASLGNIVRQLHIHCIARTEQDPLWPQGIWQTSNRCTAYSDIELKKILPSLEHLVMQANKFFT
jgi:diadenosine tetraphosphate (Ap4A) HIT family hydrolase